MTEMQFYFQQLEKQHSNIEQILSLSSQLQEKYGFEQFMRNRPIQMLPE